MGPRRWRVKAKASVLWPIGVAIGAAVGTGVYQLVRYGVAEADWARVVYVAIFTYLVALLIPKKWILR
jgi:hypothetical protein